jgi:hypothetical protein
LAGIEKIAYIKGKYFMRLDDLVRETTQEILDAIRLVEGERQRIQREKDAADERIKHLGTEIPCNRTLVGEKKHRIRDLEDKVRELNVQIEELERKKQDLYERWEERTGELTEEKKAISSIEGKIESIQREISKENQNKTHADNELKKIEDEKYRHEDGLKKAYINAFASYLKQTNQTLNESFHKGSERKSYTLAAENLKKMRHENRDVADLCEAREEWIKILRTASVAAVKLTGESELKRIEAEIEKRFPGALHADASNPINSAEASLYFYVDDEEGGSNEGIIFLPFFREHWLSLNGGNKTVSDNIFSYFLWWISSECKADSKEVKFDCFGNFVVMMFKLGLGEFYGKNHIIMEMPGGCSTTFILAKIPNEIYKAMTYEKANS